MEEEHTSEKAALDELPDNPRLDLYERMKAIAEKETEQQQPSQKKKGFFGNVLPYMRSLPALYKALRVMGPDEERYVRPPRRYEPPEYRKGMKYCTSNEPYLRPVRYCNYRDPTVIAVANELGAYELSDRKYAEAAYWWLKDNMWYEMSSWWDAGATLRTGIGACLHLTNAYVALCRCAGIKARFKGYEMYTSPIHRAGFFEKQEGGPNLVGDVFPDSETEVFIDGTWIPTYPTQTNALTAGSGWPIARFGESGTDLYFDVLPGSTHRYEAIPSKMARGLRMMGIVCPALCERVNVTTMGVQLFGLKELEEAGGVEGYNRKAWRVRQMFDAKEIVPIRHTSARRANLVIEPQ